MWEAFRLLRQVTARERATWNTIKQGEDHITELLSVPNLSILYKCRHVPSFRRINNFNSRCWLVESNLYDGCSASPAESNNAGSLSTLFSIFFSAQARLDRRAWLLVCQRCSVQHTQQMTSSGCLMAFCKKTPVMGRNVDNHPLYVSQTMS